MEVYEAENILKLEIKSENGIFVENPRIKEAIEILLLSYHKASNELGWYKNSNTQGAW